MVFAFPVVGLLGGLLHDFIGGHRLGMDGLGPKLPIAAYLDCGHRLGMDGLVQVGCVMVVDDLVDSKSDRAYACYDKSGCEDVPARLQDSFADGLSTVYV